MFTCCSGGAFPELHRVPPTAMVRAPKRGQAGIPGTATPPRSKCTKRPTESQSPHAQFHDGSRLAAIRAPLMNGPTTAAGFPDSATADGDFRQIAGIFQSYHALHLPSAR
ncbi:hypothetical protein COEREDRAFT_9118 [Coemansia reversa NRRL 1564]|uniref:Uncharacterized protein n=1 Tax=Coemansia reversa (strain ATCC 12441 / NRRL 1564) TaxID=763665 RepID=A0A2G5B9F1_COERN|nr:hypothetical protein COEREDRAFT_9118 [Coemansia reversa NRRL 1564]|eukprot:PIA15646.1 hypothetical protein COEREDRAFT_9118 [Coemansia reversa NRRL 1564]